MTWYEEPVSSADLEGLRLLRDRGPGGLDVAAGEYAFVPRDFLNLLQAGAVDCMQVDVTRAGGITGVLAAAGLADGVRDRRLRPLRAAALGARALRREPPAPPRVLPRPRPRRVDALRRRARAGGRRRAAARPLAAGPRPRAEAGGGRAVVRLIREGREEPPQGAGAEAAGGLDRVQRAAARVRDLPRALQGLLRRQVDVDADLAHAAADRGGCRGRGLREGGADGAPRRNNVIGIHSVY